MMDHNTGLIAAAEAYMLAVKRLGEESGYNRLTYFEAPILKMPTEDMREEAHERWLELNISGQQLSDAVNAAKLTINERQAVPESGPAETWAHIERLLTEECGLREDEGLQGQRANCINAIKNGLPDAALMAAAVEFLSSGEGLHKIRVNGKMMTRKDVSLALSRPHGKWDEGYDEGCGPDSQRAFDKWKSEGGK